MKVTLGASELKVALQEWLAATFSQSHKITEVVISSEGVRMVVELHVEKEDD